MFELTPFVRKNHPAQAYNPFRDLDEFERSFFGRNDVAEFKTDIKKKKKEYIDYVESVKDEIFSTRDKCA